MIIFEWTVAFTLLFLGVLGGWILYFLTTEVSSSPNMLLFLSSFGSLLIYGALFSYRRKNQEEMQSSLDNLQFQSGAVAHEMRTPLGTVLMNGMSLKRKVESLEKTLGPGEETKPLSQKELQDLKKIAESLIRLAKGAQNLITLLLANLRQDFKNVPQTVLSMDACLHTLMEEFAFKPHEEEKVHITIPEDFSFKGSEDLILHVFFNLLKNSLYFIQSSGKGEVFITHEKANGHNVLIFKDTGPGIEPHRLGHLFKPFYSRRPHGTGIGLSFCKKAIESMGGTITATSTLGEHTTFTLTFPQLDNASAPHLSQ